MSHTIRILSAADIVQALPMPDAIEGMNQAFIQLSLGQANMPLRSRVPADKDGTMLVMPAYLSQTNDLAVKVVSVFPNNTAQNLPIIYSAVTVFDPSTGKPLAVMEGGTLTAIRTGAGSGAATDVLARQDSKVVAIIGSGVQAKTQLEAVCAIRDIERVFVYSRTISNAEKFAEDMKGVGRIPNNILVAQSPTEAIKNADIVCAATTSNVPVFDGHHLKAGVHINGVGSYTPQMQEIDEYTLQQALITVDSRESVLAEAGELIIAINNESISKTDIHAEIGDILSGTKTGRQSNDQITFFKSCGVAVQDAIAAAIAFANAEANDIGQVVPF